MSKQPQAGGHTSAMFGKASGRKGKSPSKGKQQKGQHKGQQKGPWANPEPAGSWWGGWQEPEAATGEACEERNESTLFVTLD